MWAVDLSSITLSFVYGEGREAERQEVTRNVRNILTTPVGSCPLYRDFGIDASPVDYPMDTAQNIIAVEIAEAVERYEPRAQVTEVTFDPDMSGLLKAKVVVRIE